MKEVKSPKKPMAFYYIVVLALILLFNEMARPYMEQAQIVPVDYSTFMQSIDDKTVDHVEIQSNQILYTVKDDHKKYKTGIMNDPTLAQRLMESGATFTQDIKEETSPLMSFFLAWILPLLIFFAIGPVHEPQDHGPGGRQLDDVRRLWQSGEDLRAVVGGHPLQRCGRRG